MANLDVLGLCGSLRTASFNGAALRLAGAALPASMTLQTFDWRELPLYDGDVEAQGMPPLAVALKERIARADAVLIATPEYNFSIPGGLKNLIDWTSRGGGNPWRHKPVALLSASAGPLGGGRVQYDLRKVLLCLEALVMAKPEVFIGAAAGKFDTAGNCTDEATRQVVAKQMLAFEGWIAAVGRFRAE